MKCYAKFPVSGNALFHLLDHEPVPFFFHSCCQFTPF